MCAFPHNISTLHRFYVWHTAQSMFWCAQYGYKFSILLFGEARVVGGRGLVGGGKGGAQSTLLWVQLSNLTSLCRTTPFSIPKCHHRQCHPYRGHGHWTSLSYLTWGKILKPTNTPPPILFQSGLYHLNCCSDKYCCCYPTQGRWEKDK